MYILLILVEGKTFAFGYSHKGRLGCVNEDKCLKKTVCHLPISILGLDGIQMTQVKAGNFYSLAISNKGKLYGWGENKNFVLGNMNDEDSYDKKAELFYYPVELKANKALIVFIFIKF
jgi:alpha-tubulin suppressor-like RCC1 family protein